MARLDPSGSPRLLGQENVRTARLMVYLLLAVALMAMDQRGQYVSQMRALANTAAEPLFYLVDWPSRALRAVRERTQSFDELAADKEDLERQLLLQAAAAQRLEALEQENRRLHAMLQATEGHLFDYQFAEMLSVDLDPLSHRVMIDRGAGSGVFVGQAVIDGRGIMGQVESVQPNSAAIRLISDPDHALPVQLNRTGLRTVAFGTGTTDALLLPNVPQQADVRAGDLLVTSGLGDRFPPGFPVAEVTSIERAEGEMFARVTARPLAALDRGREVLLVVSAPVSLEQAEPSPEELSAPDPGPVPVESGQP